MRSIIFLSVAFFMPLSAIQYDIDNLLKASQENSAFLDAKNLQIKASGLMIDQARVWGNPTLSGDFGGITQNDISGFSYSFRVSQPFFFPGKQKLRAAFAAYNQQLEILSLQERKQLIQFNVLQAAYRYKLTEELLHHFQKRLDRFKVLRAAIAAKPVESPEIRAQKFIIESALKNSERDYLNLQRELAVALQSLSVYVKIKEPPEFLFLTFDKVTPLDRGALFAEVTANNILIKKIAIQVSQAETNSRLLSREAYPDVNVAAFYNKDTGPFQEHRFGAGVSLPIPIFNRNQHAVAAAERHAQAALKEREYAIELLKRDFNAAFEEYLVAVQILEKYPVNQVETSNLSLQNLTQEFLRGRLTTLTFADVEQRTRDFIVSAYMAQMAYVNAVLQIAFYRGADDFSTYLKNRSK